MTEMTDSSEMTPDFIEKMQSPEPLVLIACFWTQPQTYESYVLMESSSILRFEPDNLAWVADLIDVLINHFALIVQLVSSSIWNKWPESLTEMHSSKLSMMSSSGINHYEEDSLTMWTQQAQKLLNLAQRHTPTRTLGFHLWKYWTIMHIVTTTSL